MENPTLQEVIQSSEVVVHKGRYAYLKATQETSFDGHFLVSKDKDETTVVTEEANLFKVKYDKDEKWFKLFEIKVSLPFLAKGFLARVTKTVSDEGLNVLVVSTFSKDYILVREETYKQAMEALTKIGFPLKDES
ncbi:MAG: ACT domain-containing protein [Candidatus Magasanikbacteria bacterium]